MKQTVLVLYGGQSSEHTVSCMSAANVIDLIDREAWNVILVGITEDGRWILTDDVAQIRDGSWRELTTRAVLSPDATEHGIHIFSENGVQTVAVDVVFPVLHGLWGEDGTVQGLLELAKIPYVGCGVLASAVSMDKLYTKIVAATTGVRQADFVPVMKKELSKMDAVVAKIEAKFDYPVFIKPSNAGSSKGVSKADDRAELIRGLTEAAVHDRKILVEETIVGREIECAVFGNGADPVIASGLGEILPAAEFYDFEAKYYNADSKTLLNPELPNGATEKVREAAVKIFQAVDGYGLSRVDFFVTAEGEVIFNEINTLPGFTAISMYPMLFEEAGVSKKELVARLLAHGCKRYDR